jgi:uroporphyrinogen-III synthase
MDDRQPTLLLTRPEKQSLEFLADCENKLGRRLSVVVSPVFKIDFRRSPPDLSNYETVILTSSNGVAACAEALVGRKVVTVGEKTAAAARRAGAEALVLGQDAEELVANSLKIEGPAVHVRGRHTRGSIAKRLGAAGVKTDELVLYDQLAQPLTQAAVAVLQGDAEVIAPVFSPRSAELLSQAHITASLHVIAMSEAVADAWNGPGSINVVASPTADAMIAQVVSHF